MKTFLKVIKSGTVSNVPSEKSDNGTLSKRTLVLQELGGKYENQYVITLWGNQAVMEWEPGNLVYAVLRFQAREYNGQVYQDVAVSEIVKF